MPDVIATYRLQFRPEFGFAEAAAVIPYLKALGVSHIYASPVFRARPGSAHGYDGVDPNRLNPELGSPQDWERLLRRRRAAGIGWLQDIVPNHMAYHADNRLLADIFEHGPASAYRDFFDIDWHHPAEDLEGRVMAPFLGNRYRECLRNGDIRLAFEAAGFAARVYGEMRFPLAIETYLEILDHGELPAEGSLPADDPDHARLSDALDALESLALLETPARRVRQVRAVKATLWDLHARRTGLRRHIEACLARLNGEPGNLESFRDLDRLLSRQRFRLCWWKNANEEINYRRFFDINELIATRQEDQNVFDHTHDRIAAMSAEGSVDGVRIDHVDGLADPAGYLRSLRRRLGAGAVIVVEKILSPEEDLPPAWPVQGTTGYDFAHWLNALFVRRENEAAFTDIYQTYTGREASFEAEVHRAKSEILATRLAGDLANLVRRLQTIAVEDRFADHLTPGRIAGALKEVLTCFPIYRTYFGDGDERPWEHRIVAATTDRARKRRPEFAAEIAFVRDLILNENRHRCPEGSTKRRDAVRRFQQLSSALMAKGCEDTAFYRYHRLVSLNEVGGEPGSFGCRREQFHRFVRNRAAAWPLTMNSTATHDSKRGEDLRARLNVLSELPEAWRRRVGRWYALTRNFRTRVHGTLAPDRNTVYLLFQTLVGAWPEDPRQNPPFEERIQTYLLKAVREAGEATSWIDPQEAYEAALHRFVAAILAPSPDNLFLADFVPFCRRIAFYGRFNTLSQCLIKIAAPGIPDFYQGTELSQLALVDPDNRRPVAYRMHEQTLKALGDRPQETPALAAERVASAADGHTKLFLIARALDARRRYQEVFGSGRYLALNISGAFAINVVAFARRTNGQWALALAPRFLTDLVSENEAPLGPDIWQDTVVHLPSGAPADWHNVFTGQQCRADGHIAVGEALSHFPVALLISKEAP